MAKQRISELLEVTSSSEIDLVFPAVDRADTSQSESGTNKIISARNLLSEARFSGLTLAGLRAKALGEDGNIEVITDRGGGFFYTITDQDPGTFTDNDGTVIVPSTGSGSDGSGARLRIYSGPIYCEWFGAVGDGDVSKASANVAAIQKSLLVASKEEGGALSIGPGDFYIDDMIHLDDLRGLIFHGAGESSGSDNLCKTTFLWAGDTDTEAFRITQSQFITLGRFEIKTDSNYPLAIGIRLYRDENDSSVQRKVTCEHIKFNGNDGYVGTGFQVDKHESASDANNSEHVISHCSVRNYGDGNGLFSTTAAVKVLQAQAKVLTIEHLIWSTFAGPDAAAGEYGIYSHASFSLSKWQATGNTIANIHLTEVNDTCYIGYGNSENSQAFLTTAGPNQSACPVHVEDVRFAAGDVESPFRVVDFQFNGPLKINTCVFRDGTDVSKSLYMRFGGTRRGNVTVEDTTIVSSDWPIEFGPVEPRLRFTNNTRRPSDTGQSELWPDVIPSKWVQKDHWAPFFFLAADGERRMGTGVRQISDVVRHWDLNQATAANQPAHVRETGGARPYALSFDGGTQYMAVDTTYALLSDQKFQHDGSTDWEMLIPFYIDSSSSTGRRFYATGTGPGVDTGVYASYKSGNDIEITIYNGTSREKRCNMAGEAVPDSWQLLRVTYDQSADEFTCQIDDGTPVVDSAAGSYDSADSAHPITIGADGDGSSTCQCKIGEVFISKTIADSELKTEQDRFYGSVYDIDALKP